MTARELLTYLTEGAGLDDATVQILMKAAENEKVANRAVTFKQQSEYDQIQQKAQQLQAELDGTGAQPGTRAYAKWYQENFAQIDKLQKDMVAYRERFGDLDGTVPATAAAATAAAARGTTPEDIARLVDERIAKQYGPQWSSHLKATTSIIQKHLRAGRKNDVDMEKLASLATEKYNGNLEQAYDEYDAPERELTAKAAEDKRVEDRVKQELEKRLREQTAKTFPGGADATPSDSPLSKDRGKTPAYDRSKVIEAAITGNYDGYAGTGAGKKAGHDFFSN